MKLILTFLRKKQLFTVGCVVLISGVFTVGLWVATPKAFAATGINNQINFQGKLVGNTGLNVADGTYSVVFTLYDAAGSGANLWTETDSVTTTDGIFQVSLGVTNPTLGTVDFNSDSIYLGIKVGADAEMTPRIRFTAVPYAFNAQKVGGLTVTNTTGTLTVQNGKTISFADAFTTSGANPLTLTTTGSTNITLPTTGTLSTLAGSEVLTNKTIGSTGLTFSGSGTDVTTVSNEDFTVTPNGSGNIVLTGDADSQVLIGANSASTKFGLFVNNAIGSNAALAVNNANSGDLFVASQAGATKFRIANNGDIVLTAGVNVGGTVGTSAQCLIGGATAAWGACGSGGTNYLRLANGAFSLANDTADFLFGNAASTSAKFKLSATGTAPVASVSATSSFAGFVVNNSGVGDLFTASKSGATKFTILNNGNIQFAGTTNFLNTITTAATAARTYTLPNATGTICVSGDSCAASGIVGLFQRALGTIAPSNITDDLLLGGTSTTSAKFAFINNVGPGEPTASIAGSITLRNGVGQINRLNGGSINLQTSAGGDTGLSTKLFVGNPGTIGIGTNNVNPLATLDVRSVLGTRAIASISGATSFAGLTVDNSGVGDLFTASKSGAKKFVINNAGDVTVGATTGTPYGSYQGYLGNFQAEGSVQAGILGSRPTLALLPGSGGASLGIVNWYDAFGNLFGSLGANGTEGGLYIPEYGLGIGISSSTSKLGTLDVRAQSGTLAVATVSGSTAKAVLAVDQSGVGDLFTASKSGATKFAILNNGNVRINNLTSCTGIQTDGTGLLSCGAGGGGPNFLRLANGAFSLVNDTADFLFGSSASNSAAFKLSTSGTAPTASVAGTTANAALVVDNTGVGDLFAASKSGATKFVVKNNGNVGIGTSNPGYKLSVVGADATTIGFISGATKALSFGATASQAIISATDQNVGTYQQLALAGSNIALAIQGVTKAYLDPNGSLGIGTTIQNATLDVRGNIGTTPVASIAGVTSQAASVVDNSGVGDLFTASKSGATKFVITNAGNVGIGTNTPAYALDVVGDVNTSGVFRIGTVPLCTSVGCIPTATSSNYIQNQLALAQPANFFIKSSSLTVTDPTVQLQLATSQTGDLLQFRNVGGALIGKFDSSANLAVPNFVDLAGTGPYLSFGGAATILNTRTGGNTGLVVQAGNAVQTGDLVQLQNAGGNVISKFTGIGQLGIGTGTNTALAALDVRGLSGTTPVASVAGLTTNAALIVDNSGVGDLFTASKSGATKFVIKNNGDVQLTNNLGVDGGNITTTATTANVFSNATTLNLGGAGTQVNTGDITSFAPNGTIGEIDLANGSTTAPVIDATHILYGLSKRSDNLSFWNYGYDGTTFWNYLKTDWNNKYLSLNGDGIGRVGIGTLTPQATLDIAANSGTLPILNVSGATSFAASSVNQTGAGDIFTASKSGATRFVINNAGNVGVGTTNPTEKFTLTGGNFVQTASGNPTPVGSYDTPGTTKGVYVSGKYAYAADDSSGLQIIDVSVPSSPQLVGTYNTSGQAISVYVAGKYAYVADTSSGLQIIDVSIPSNPQLVGTYDTSGSAGSVYVSGKYAYVADGSSGLQIIDVSVPSNPQLVGTYNTAGNAVGVYISGSYAYVADASSGTQIIDVSVPSNPRLTGTFAPSFGFAQGVYVSGKYLYVADDTYGLQIADISNPSSPVLTGGSGSGGSGVYVSGRYAYLANSASGVQVYDVAAPAAPQLVGTYNPGGTEYALTVAGRYLYVGDGASGLQVISINGMETPALFAGNVATNDLTVTENGDFGNNLLVRNGLNVGSGGIYANGSLTLQSTTSAQFRIEGTQPGQSLAIFNQTGTDNDIFTASMAGVTKFTITETGDLQVANLSTAGGVLYTNGSGTIAQSAQGTSGNCLLSNGASSPTWGACITGNGASTLRITNGAISPVNDTVDFLVGSNATASATFSVQGVNGGQGAISKFQTSANTLPQVTTDTRPITANGYIYVIGGDTTAGAYTANSYYARVNGNGDVDRWVQTTPLPVALTTHGTVIYNGYVYVAGGLTGSGFAAANAKTIVYYSKINSDGSIGAWNTTSSLPTGLFNNTLAAANGYIYSVGGGNTSNTPQGYTYAKVNADGTLGAWKAMAAMTNYKGSTAAVTAASVVIANGLLYVVGGGDNAAAIYGDVAFAKLQNDGSLSQFFMTTALPALRSWNAASVANGYLYVMGGSSLASTQATNTVYYGKLNANGTISSWTTSPMQIPTTNAFTGGVQVNGYMYLIGGESGTGTTVNTVYYTSTARVQMVGSLDLVGLTSGQVASASGTGGSIYAGNIFSIGDLSINGNTQLWNGLTVNGGQNLTGGLSVFGTSGTMPAASISAKSSFAALVVNNSGVGDLMTASSGGQTRFRMSNNGSVLFQGDTISSSTSALLVNNGSGAVSNTLGDQGSLVPNSGFEANLSNSIFADGWVVAATSSAAVSRDTTLSARGSTSARVTLNNSNAAFYSACVPMTGVINSVYTLNYYAKSNANTPTVRAYIDGYATKLDCQNNKLVQAPVPVATTAITTSWVKYGSNTTAIPNTSFGATTTWGRVHFYVATGSNTFVNIDGVRLTEVDSGQGVDYAENYPADPNNTPEPGDVVSLQAVGDTTQVTRTSTSMDQSAIGVVSTNPGQVLDDGSMTGAKVAVALAGRIPTKVSTKNGAIHVGDYLTSSDMPGVAVKAISAGPVLGQAMEEYDESDPAAVGRVVMFVKNTYYNGIPLGLNSGLVQDHNQGDLEFLGQLVTASQKSASASGALTKIAADRIVAGLDVLAPKVTTDTLQVNTISSANGLTLQLGNNTEFAIKTASDAAAIRFDGKGNAFFAGTITAGKITANQIEGLEIMQTGAKTLEARIKTLEDYYASSSAIMHDGLIAKPTPSVPEALGQKLALASLSVDENASVSGNLRVKGNVLVEGIINVIDTLTANNLIVNSLADFFGTVVFHNAVTFQTPPAFSEDTAGYVTIKKGSDKTQITFKKAYEETPVVNASLVTTPITEELYKSLTADGICDKDEDKAICQEAFDKAALEDSKKYVISNRSEKGFVIMLTGDASYDMTFSWTALTVKKGGDTQ